MLKIGNLTIEGRGTRPRSRKDFKKEIRSFASGDLGLQLRFVTRRGEEYTHSYCNPHRRIAVICEGVNGKLYPLCWVIELTLHEIAHWIQYNEGMFKDYFGKTYYGGILLNSSSSRLALRAERHADLLAGRMLKEMYGMKPCFPSVYANTREAREFLHTYYGKL